MKNKEELTVEEKAKIIADKLYWKLRSSGDASTCRRAEDIVRQLIIHHFKEKS